MNDKVITIFGGTGFIGSSLITKLAKSGAKLKVVSRNENSGDHIKPNASIGQIYMIRGDICDPAFVFSAIEGSDIVINLVGILIAKRSDGFAAIHTQGAENIAKAAKKARVQTLIHCSALSVDKNAHSEYARSKLRGEEAVRKAFPKATIIRPSIIFGRHDNFYNMFAKIASISPFLPLIGGGNSKFQPVFVEDVCLAITAIISDSNTQGNTYELGGPNAYSFKEIMRYILRTTHKRRLLLPIPYFVATIQAFFMELLLPTPPLTRDQVKLLKIDNIVDDNSLDLKDLNIDATPVEAIVPKYLERYQ